MGLTAHVELASNQSEEIHAFMRSRPVDNNKAMRRFCEGASSRTYPTRSLKCLNLKTEKMISALAPITS